MKIVRFRLLLSPYVFLLDLYFATEMKTIECQTKTCNRNRRKQTRTHTYTEIQTVGDIKENFTEKWRKEGKSKRTHTAYT